MSSPRPLRDVAAMFVILVATLAVFAPVYNFDFTSWDDYDTVARNPLLNPPTIRSLNAFWTRPHGDLYIPVTYTVWAGVAAMPSTTEPATPTSLPRLRPQAFHIVNVVFHAAAAVL
ncbi:MAG: protein O-mannosyl-transferase, partial [Phycisphaerales bacterium]|nr:protein O-mannosyl-transferase [Phycisphaerales bacterium]